MATAIDVHDIGINTVAELLGVGTRTVQGFVRSGMPCLVKGAKSKPWSFDGPAVMKWYVAQKISDSRGVSPDPDNPETTNVKTKLDEARLRKLNFDATASEIRVNEALGQLMDANAVSVALAKLAMVIRSDLESMPVSLSVSVAAEGDIDACRRLMAAEVNNVLNSIADEFERIAEGDLSEFDDTEDDYLNSPEGEGGGDVD